jgi:hypothetical protein
VVTLIDDDVLPARRHAKTGRLHLDKRAARIVDELLASTPDLDQLMSTHQVAHLTETSHQFWESLRHDGTGPPYVKIAPRAIRYRREDVLAFLRERVHRHTQEYQSSNWVSRRRNEAARAAAEATQRPNVHSNGNLQGDQSAATRPPNVHSNGNLAQGQQSAEGTPRRRLMLRRPQ